MKKILLIGDENRVQIVHKILENKGYEIEISDGDEEEDFKEYYILFDLNFDDDSENFPIYASLKEKIIFLSSVKQSLSEISYIYPSKVRSRIFGINALPNYLESETWELSLFRGNELEYLEGFVHSISQKYIIVEDRVGMLRPRCQYLQYNELIKSIDEGILPRGTSDDWVQKQLQEIDTIGVTSIFETLMALYEDTKEIKFLPASLLKKKYLRNHNFVR